MSSQFFSEPKRRRVELSRQLSFRDLPTDCIFHILQYCPSDTLLTFRLLSKTDNNLLLTLASSRACAPHLKILSSLLALVQGSIASGFSPELLQRPQEVLTHLRQAKDNAELARCAVSDVQKWVDAEKSLSSDQKAAVVSFVQQNFQVISRSGQSTEGYNKYDVTRSVNRYKIRFGTLSLKYVQETDWQKHYTSTRERYTVKFPDSSPLAPLAPTGGKLVRPSRQELSPSSYDLYRFTYDGNYRRKDYDDFAMPRVLEKILSLEMEPGGLPWMEQSGLMVLLMVVIDGLRPEFGDGWASKPLATALERMKSELLKLSS